MNMKASALLLTVSAALFLGGCGSRDEDSPTTSPSASSSADSQEASSESQPPTPSASPDDETILQAFEERAQAGQASPDVLFDELEKAVENADSATADDLVRAMEKYYDSNLEVTNEKFGDSNVQSELVKLQFPVTEEQVKTIKNDEVRQLAESAIQGGYKLETAEGMVFPVVDYAKLKTVASRVSPAMSEYLAVMSDESENPTAKDAGLTITWDELANRAIAAEAYVRSYPDSPERSKIETKFVNYLQMYLVGLSNTEIYGDDYKVLAEVKELYGKIAQEYPDTVTGKLSKEMLEVLSDTGDAVFRKAGDGMQEDIPAMKKFRDEIESEARAGLPSIPLE